MLFTKFLYSSEDKMILITGFAGSIGGEFTRQLLQAGKEVVGVDNNEWAVAQFENHPKLTKRLMNCKDITGTFDLVIHCAAYKHVDLVENNQDSGLENNVMVTRELFKNVRFSKFLFMSTDKTVEPASFYGWTKHEGEQMTKEHGGIVARLGNILASTGSVIPRWERCIDEGIPLPVTDPKMTRYMIPVDEAVFKMLKLLRKAKPGQVIIPEMGEPIVLSDLIKKVLEKKGLKDYPIDIIGLRPGEKINEKLKWDYEKTILSNKYGEIVEGEE